jgi:hypothetical protein
VSSQTSTARAHRNGFSFVTDVAFVLRRNVIGGVVVTGIANKTTSINKAAGPHPFQDEGRPVQDDSGFRSAGRCSPAEGLLDRANEL